MRLRAQKRLKRVLEHFSGIRAEEAVRQPARLFFCLQKSKENRERVPPGAAAPFATRKKAEHREKARVFESIFRSDIILDTAAVSKCQLIYEGI